MSELSDRLSPSGPAARSKALDWSALFRRSTPEGALREVAGWLEIAEGLEAILETVEEPGGLLARYPAGEGVVTPGPAPGSSRDVEIPGRPAWRLRVTGQPTPAAAVLEAGAAIAAWRAARVELDRDERRLEARTRELALLQDLGRSSAEARTPETLFRTAAQVLHSGTGADAVAAVDGPAGEPRVEIFLARPLSREHLDVMARRAVETLGWEGDDDRGIGVVPLDDFDPQRGVRQSLHADDLVVLPISRRGRTVAALAVLFSEREEAKLRLVYGAANQLSLHLDRILTVREAEQDRFRSILDSMSQAVLLTDPSLRLIQANPAATGILEELSIERPDGSLTRLGDLDLAPLAEAVCADPRRPVDGEARLAEGRIATVTVSGVTGEGGSLEGLVLVIADVTERRRLQQQLAQTEKLSSLGQMISGIAHELNNPLASVLGYAQLVKSVTTDDKLARRLGMIHDESRRCQRIVQNLLSFARRHEPERKPLSLNEVAGSVLHLVGYQLRVAAIEVKTELDPDLPAIHGDAHQLQQCILNLVTNAQHAIRDTGRPGTITVTTRAHSQDRVSLVIADDGPGISAENLSKIYDPFFTTKEAGEGTGLGLSIVYGIITSHGGTIAIDSDRETGAAFTIELPVGSADATAAAEEHSAEPPGKVRGANVLVVDDERAVAGLIGETLETHGHRVTRAHEVLEAIERVTREAFDLVVVDLRMPGMRIESFRDELDRLRAGLGKRIVLVTGDTVSAEPESVAQRLGLRVLHKPFDLEDLLEAVRSAL
jgi:signal transduction histidine kinase